MISEVQALLIESQISALEADMKAAHDAVDNVRVLLKLATDDRDRIHNLLAVVMRVTNPGEPVYDLIKTATPKSIEQSLIDWRTS